MDRRVEHALPRRALGRTGIEVSALGYGAFKIGRNQGIKYPAGYELPDDDAVRELVAGLTALGINYIDTAPAYGTAEARIGAALDELGKDVVLSTKVGETFSDGRSHFDFAARAMADSVARSLARLRREAVDLLLIHSDGRDLEIQRETDAIATLRSLKERGLARAIGFSGKTVEGADAAIGWADAIMVEYHLERRDHEPVIARAAEAGVGVIVKKGLGSGRLEPAAAIRFVLRNPGVSTLVVGSLRLDNMRRNRDVARAALAEPPA